MDKKINKTTATVLLKVIGVVFCFLFCLATKASSSQQTAEWIQDENHQLSLTALERIAQPLKEAATKRNIHVRVVILNHPDADTMEQTYKSAIDKWEKNHPGMRNKHRLAYLILNPATQTSAIELGRQVQVDQGIIEALNDIQQKILTPALIKEDIEAAAWQGAVALSIAVEVWPPLMEVSALTELNRWLKEKNLLSLDQFLRWLVVTILLYFITYGFKNYFRKPHWEASFPTSTKKLSLEEELALYGDKLYWQQIETRARELEN